MPRGSPGMLATVLRAPGSGRLFAASLVGRTPAAALGLVLVLHVKELTGSFAAGGVVSGAAALGSAAGAPVVGRAVDRRGQPPVLLTCALLSGTAMTTIGLLPHGVPVLVAMACAAAAGAGMPPLGACLRALWPRLLGDPERIHAAFALESSGMEVTYIAGPVLIAGAIGAWSTAAACFSCAAVQLAGTAAFASSAHARAWSSVPAGGAPRPARVAGALKAPGMRTLVLVFVMIGAAFGAIEVAVPAASSAAGAAGAAGVLLGVWGVGSLLGGLVAARAGAPADPVRRLCALLALLAGGHLLLAIPTSLVVLGALLVLAGGAIAPSLALAYGLVEPIAPPGTVTEAYTWLTSGITAGVAAGSSLAGILAEGPGPAAAFAAAGVACAAAATAGATRRASLAPQPAAA